MSADAPRVWRIHIRPRGGTDPRTAVEFCVRRSVIGIGWCVDGAPKTAKDYWRAGDKKYAGRHHRGWSAAARAILWRIPVGDLVWFRDTFGRYYIARVTGKWRYCNTEDSREAGIFNIRACRIYCVGTGIPGRIVNSFIRNATIQQIHDDTVRLFSIVKFNELSGESLPMYRTDATLFSLLSTRDLEDLVGLYLQRRKDLLLIPGSQQRNSTTIAYEFELVDPKTGHAAYVQVKSGHLKLDPASYYRGVGEDGDRKYYLFSPAGYQRPSEHRDVICLEKAEIDEFLREAHGYLPANIRTWVDWLGGHSKTA